MKYLIDLHTHTNVNPHAYSTLDENIRAAKAKGLKVIAVTNHGPALPDSPHWWSHRNMRVLPEEIDGVRLLKGIEANILDDSGNIDLNQDIYDVMDIILAGFHKIPSYPDGSDIEKNTRAAVNLIKSQQVDVLVHLGNPGFPLDYNKVLKTAREFKVAIELNNSSFRGSRKGSESNCKSIISLAKKYGCYIALGSDAHFAAHVGDLDIIADLLEKTDFPKDLIINFSVEKLDDFLGLRKKLRAKNIPDNI